MIVAAVEEEIDRGEITTQEMVAAVAAAELEDRRRCENEADEQARELLSPVKSARGYFLVVGLELVTAWLSHPLIANLQSLVAWARRARGREILLRTKVESFQTLVHLGSCQNHRPHVQSLVH